MSKHINLEREHVDLQRMLHELQLQVSGSESYEKVLAESQAKVSLLEKEIHQREEKE